MWAHGSVSPMATRRTSAARRSDGARSQARSASARDGHDPEIRQVASNRRARHDYDILETYECGIALKGAEVKSLRLGHVSLQDAYARIDDGECWLVGAHLAPYSYASGFGRFDPDRPRKLLLHRGEIDELAGKVAQKALTLIPLAVYFKDGRAKVTVALARGRRLYDKRRVLAERDATREAQRAIRDQGRERRNGNRGRDF
jgi:SsrA-binding protein